ncbi:MAG TPA: hypothetical protein VJA45_10860 [Methylomirabilota bacterium]|jgi:hypothetical protein|nr:hypothetical protein [Methylomirabilota bacterium]
MEVFIGIDIDKVERVLLTDGWHAVKDASFIVGNYGFVRGPTVIVNAIAIKGTVSHWARWTETEGKTVACPLTAILAVGAAAVPH